MANATEYDVTEDRLKEIMDPRVSRYDKVSALLVALVVMFGFLALLLLILWFTSIVRTKPKVANTAPMIELPGGEPNQGVGDVWEEPGTDELPDVEQPQLADAVEAVTDAISSQSAKFATIDGNAELMGPGSGLGDARARGTGGTGTGGGEPDRWTIQMTTSSEAAYAKALDSLGIQLAAVHASSDEIVYAFRLASGKPSVRKGTRAQYNTSGGFLFFQQIAALKKYDQSLLRKAGVALGGRRYGWYLPPQARQALYAAEALKRGGRPVEQVAKTVFEVQPDGNGYKFTAVNVTFK